MAAVATPADSKSARTRLRRAAAKARAMMAEAEDSCAEGQDKSFEKNEKNKAVLVEDEKKDEKKDEKQEDEKQKTKEEQILDDMEKLKEKVEMLSPRALLKICIRQTTDNGDPGGDLDEMYQLLDELEKGDACEDSD